MDEVKLLPCPPEGTNAQEAHDRLRTFVNALDAAEGYDAKRELWLQAADDSQFEKDLRRELWELDDLSVHAKRWLGERATRQPIVTDEVVERDDNVEFDDGAGVAYTIAKLREELDGLYRSQPQKDAPKIRPGVIHETGPSIIGRLQQIDHLQRYQIACLERHLALTLNPPRHKFWGAGEPDCPREIKAGNGELHTLRCKACGQDDPRDDFCRNPALAAMPTIDQDGGELRGKRPRIPTPEMIAAAWAVIERDKKATGVAKLGPGLGVREIWQAMYDAASEPPAQPENDQCQD